MKWFVAAAVALAATPAWAQGQERDLCTDRPGMGTPACTVDRGRVVVEVGLADWTRDQSMGTRTDTVLFGDTLVRIGVADMAELELGLTSFGYQRDNDGGAVSRQTRVGDAFVGMKLNLASPDGSHFSAAVLPYATLPTGLSPIGAGDWAAGLVVPVSYELSSSLQLQASPQFNAAVDQDGHGRHAAYGTTVGLGVDISDAVTAAIEYQGIRDRDPSGHSTQSLGGLSLAWQPSKNLQFDIGTNVGLNGTSDDVEIYGGISKRF